MTLMDPLAVRCLACGALPGQRCRTAWGTEPYGGFHRDRREGRR